MSKFPVTAVFVAGLCAALPALAQSPTVSVQNVWARATSSSQKVGGVFLTVTENGPADRLVAASSPVADVVQLHETINDAGVMKMRAVSGLPLATGQTVELKPGGYHLMAMGLKQPLVPGDSFPLTLMFDKAGAVRVVVTVAAAGASGPAMPAKP
jgi:copper(I)-binding protein